MLIKQILSGRRKSSFIIVKDNGNYDGFSIIRKFIEENNQRFTRIHLLLSIAYRIDIKPSENIILHKYFPDPWKLLAGSEVQLTFEQIIDCILNEKSINEKTNILFVIDSVVSLLQHVSLHSLCTSLKRLIDSSKTEETHTIQSLCLLHSDLLPDDSNEYKQLAYMATSIITCPSGNHDEIDLEYRQCNGKILKETYNCTHAPRKELLFEIKKEKPKEDIQEAHEKLVSTTFKLTLEEKEKESRSQVILPYVKTTNSIGKGRIFYEPDVNDDWDDEDPDDDLEI